MTAPGGNISLASLMGGSSRDRYLAYSSSIRAIDHEKFRGSCEAYALAHRPTFLGLFLKHFVAVASKNELEKLASAVTVRRQQLRVGRKRGRPRASTDKQLLRKAVKIAFSKYVRHLSWKAVAEEMSLRVGNAESLKSHKRTMKRQLAVLGNAIFGDADDLEEQIESISKKVYVQRMLQLETGMPFDREPLACEMILGNLAINILRRKVSKGGD